jgi:hypothetical protein
MRRITDAIDQDLKAMEFETRPTGPFGIGISVKVEGGNRTPIHRYREQDLETEVVCGACTLRYAVFGVFAFCPDCGQHNSPQILEANLDLVRKMLDLAATLEPDIAAKLIENALEDCVSAFDGFGRELASVHEALASKPKALARLSFQDLDGARQKVMDAFSLDMSTLLAPADWDVARIAFQKRHVVAHRMGVVDSEYVRKTGDPRARLGQKVSLDPDEIERLAEILSRLGPALATRLQSMGRTP